MNRREFLQCAAVIAAGGMNPTLSLSREQQAFLAAQPNYVDRPLPDLFNARQRAAVAAAAEQVIPATDTPGAIDAGVPRFIEMMVSDWFNPAERELFMTGLEDLQARAGGDYSGLSPGEQVHLLQQLEEESGDSDWYGIGNVMRVWDESAPFICQFKELTVLGYMLSEPGGTRFQRENPMGEFDGRVPLSADAPAHAAELPLRMIASEVEQ